MAKRGLTIMGTMKAPIGAEWQCGCKVAVLPGLGNHQWDQCPLHATAPLLLEALEGLVGAYGVIPTHDAITKARHAINAARGHDHGPGHNVG